MKQLTTDYLDKALGRQSKELKGYVDKRIDGQTSELKTYVQSEIKTAIDDLARITARGFDEIQKRLDVVERVEKVEKIVYKMAQAINLTI